MTKHIDIIKSNLKDRVHPVNFPTVMSGIPNNEMVEAMNALQALIADNIICQFNMEYGILYRWNFSLDFHRDWMENTSNV